MTPAAAVEPQPAAPDPSSLDLLDPVHDLEARPIVVLAPFREPAYAARASGVDARGRARGSPACARAGRPG